MHGHIKSAVISLWINDVIIIIIVVVYISRETWFSIICHNILVFSDSMILIMV